ncbi:Sodium/calcium exchanger protein-domain-containing protein [Infundibulicybe gibba]|nr:Sodium/calcium exchanger protein-domain-containing protein [Infundibulicybe gibba]
MGESFALPAHDVSNHALSQPALASVVAEDDDEPPSSSRLQSRPPQIENEPSAHPQLAHADIKDGIPNLDGVYSNTVVSMDTKGDSNASAFMTQRRTVPVGNEKTDVSARPMPVRRPTALSTTARFRALFTPVRPLGPPPTYSASFMAALRYTPLNICLAFIPVSWALHYTNQSPTLIFIFASLGIIPLAALLGLGTEQIALRTSQSVGGLLNATLGNIVEMIIAGIALKHCELELVQSSLLGGLLSNLLLVLGMAFIVGGFRFHQQEFQPMVAQLNSSLMIVSVISLIVPVAFLFFQFYSHNHLFLDTLQTGAISPTSTRSSFVRASMETLPMPVAASTTSEDPETLKLNTPFALALLAATTAFAYVTAEHLVSSLEGLVADHPNISKEWITLIVIPIISNAAEHTTAVVVASKGKFDLAMSVAVGSCIQISLFVIPVLVLVAWGMDKPLTLLFDPLETIVLFFSVLLVKFSVEDGKSHWMSGLVLIAVYILIALSFWNFPETIRTLQGQTLLCT